MLPVGRCDRNQINNYTQLNYSILFPGSPVPVLNHLKVVCIKLPRAGLTGESELNLLSAFLLTLEEAPVRTTDRPLMTVLAIE